MAEDDALRTFRLLIERHLEPVPSFIGAVIIGSRAHDEHTAGSDLDCVLIFDEVDERIIPGEFVWVPDDDSFHSIFEVEAADSGGVQVDAVRMGWREFSQGAWPEGLTHDLARNRVVFERRHDVSGLIARRTPYDEDRRLQRIADATAWLDYHLTSWRLQRWVKRGGWLCAHDQLDAAFEELIAALHAYNRTWMPWRYRRLASALKLAWVPPDFATHVEALRSDSLEARATTLRTFQAALLAKIEEDGLDAELQARRAQAFRGLGFASSMDEWRRAHAQWIQEQS